MVQHSFFYSKIVHMLFLDGVYVDSSHKSRVRFRWVKAPSSEELTQLTHTIAHWVARDLGREQENKDIHRFFRFVVHHQIEQILVFPVILVGDVFAVIRILGANLILVNTPVLYD